MSEEVKLEEASNKENEKRAKDNNKERFKTQEKKQEPLKYKPFEKLLKK